MKKRLLALALCLVMVTSLLPVTAAAAFPSGSVMYSWVGGITPGGIYCGDIYITDASPEGFQIVDVIGLGYSVSYPAESLGNGQWKLLASDVINTVSVVFSDTSTGMYQPLAFRITSNYSHTWSAWTSNGDGTHSRTCGNGCVESPQKEFCADYNGDHECDVCKASVHTWQFKAAGNELTGYCGGANCDIGEIVLTLKADSVTLPKSPFETAELVGWKAFTDAIPSAYYNSFDYKLNGEDVTDQSNPKAGNYQVGVRIYGLPGNVEYEGVASRADMNSAYLFTQYTAVDPKVTAQTGDNRPIELMVASVVVFSALAAAAFVADSKRKYRQ